MPPGDGTRTMPNKPAAAKSLAYVLSQTPDLRWHIIFRSGPSAMVKPLGSPKDAPSVPIDPKRPDFELDGAAGALAAMEAIAEDRERFAEALPGDRHVLFLAVLAGDLADYGVTP